MIRPFGLVPSLALGVSAAFGFATTAVAQDPPAPDAPVPLIDVTGAGTLDLGDLDDVLKPHRRAFKKGKEALRFTLTVDAAGVVSACESDAATGLLAKAAEALCAHAKTKGRFRRSNYIALTYDQATYTVTVRQTADGKAARSDATSNEFWLTTGYPDLGRAVRFGGYAIPPFEEPLRLVDVQAMPMTYPQSALSRAIEARVVVALHFGEDGRVAKCHPVSSSNSTRMAYETCRAAYRSYRLLNPPDPRPYAMATVWKMAD